MPEKKMASPRKSATAAKKSTPRSRKTAASYKPFPDTFDAQVVRLVESSFGQSPIPDDADDEGLEYYFDFDTYFSVGSDGVFYGYSTCTVEQSYEDKIYADISARYAFAFAQRNSAMDKYDPYELSKYVSQSVVWPMFRSYFSIIKSQSNVKMPNLPYIVAVRIHEQDKS